MTQEEALTVAANLKEQGIEATIITFDDEERGLSIPTKVGPSIRIVRTTQLEAALEIFQEIEKKVRGKQAFSARRQDPYSFPT
jgi:hypothetical protein